MRSSLIYSVRSARKAQDFGYKAFHLNWLDRQGFLIPETYVVPVSGQLEYEQDKNRLLDNLDQELLRRLDLRLAYAARSSANLEDRKESSFAGQFRSFLNLQGHKAIIQAVSAIYEGSRSTMVQAYLERSELAVNSLKMGIILQQMVVPQVSGVSFSRNPLTGLDETIIEAVQGSGEQLVQSGMTPARWVQKWGRWIAQPEATNIDSAVIAEVAAGTRRIATEYEHPVDLEWVYDGDQIYWVQLRPITHLDNINIYSSRISREMLPGLIKPLIWSINVPMKGSLFIDLFTELTGPNKLQPDQLIRAFNYHAYFNMGVLGQMLVALGLPADTLELMMGLTGGDDKPRYRMTLKTLQHLPRLLGFVGSMMSYARNFDSTLVDLKSELATIQVDNIPRLENEVLLAEISQLYSIVQKVARGGIILPLLMGLSTAVLRRGLVGIGIDLSQIDLTGGIIEFEDYDPNPHLARLRAQYNSLDTSFQAAVRTSSHMNLEGTPGLSGFLTAVDSFIERFGHLSDSGTDFSSTPWRENPDLVLRMIMEHQPAETAGSKISWDDLSLPWGRRIFLHPVYRSACRLRLYREAVSSLYTYSYGLFRPFFLAIAERFIARGWLHQREDIFYLYFEEIKSMFQQGVDGSDLQAKVDRRRLDMQACQGISLPEIIYGDQPPPQDLVVRKGNLLKGIPTSRGYYSGPARVVRSVAESSKLCPGDVLVIPYSDVSWTPLFTRAGAVVAESGGILSHSSIIAREYNLPCVVSVSDACLIPDDTLVIVDGFSGEVMLQEGDL